MLAGCGLASSIVYLYFFTRPYPVWTGIEKPLQHFGTLSGGSPAAVAQVAAAIGLLFAIYLLAIRLSGSVEGSRAGLLILFAGGALSALSLLFMYPIFSLDVFYYMDADRIWSVYRENPFIVPPLQAAHDPFFPYTRWGHYPLPYGPLWPWISAATSSFGVGEIQPTLLAFKGLGILCYLTCLPLVAWASAGLQPRRSVTSLCVFAWNPLVLLELAGGAHNDAVALVPLIAAVGLWLRGAGAGATLGLMLSILVKATAVLAAPGLLWASAHRAIQGGRFPAWAATHLVPALVLLIAAWLPFWPGFWRSQTQEAGQYYQSISSLAAPLLGATTNPLPMRVFQVALLLLFGFLYFTHRNTLSEEGRPALNALWTLTSTYFLVVTPFFSAWYMLWPTLYAAILAERRTTVLTTLLCLGAFSTYFVQFVIRPAFTLDASAANALGLLAVAGPVLLGLLVMQLASHSAWHPSTQALNGRRGYRNRPPDPAMAVTPE